MDQDVYPLVAGWLRYSRRPAVAFTGAGISAESGIPDFRSADGVEATYPPVSLLELFTKEGARREYWRWWSEFHRALVDARPNPGHRALAEWERQGLLLGVITETVDGLHQEAGSRRVLEVYGTARQVACMMCKRRYDPEPLVAAFQQTGEVPKCPECGGILKHTTVASDQSLPVDVLREAIGLVQACDLCFVLGSSLVVDQPAVLPKMATACGARLVIINRDPTGQDDGASVVLRASIGEALTAINGCLRAHEAVAGA
jgi:NAD-dependent deacetylase